MDMDTLRQTFFDLSLLKSPEGTCLQMAYHIAMKIVDPDIDISVSKGGEIHLFWHESRLCCTVEPDRVIIRCDLIQEEYPISNEKRVIERINHFIRKPLDVT